MNWTKGIAGVALFVASGMMMQRARAGETLTERGLIREVLAGNPTLKATVAKWEAMKQRVPQARAWDDPMVGVDFERVGTTQFSTYSGAEWMVSQSLPLSGKNLSRGRAAEAEARAAYEEVRRVRLDVTARARSAYYRLANQREQLAINARNRGLVDEFIKISKAKYEVGTRSQGDVLAAQTELSKLDQERARIAKELSDQQSALNVLMNRPATAPVGEPARLAFRPLRWKAGELERRILAERPEIAAAERGVSAEQARLQLAKREWFPDPQVRVEARHFRGGSDTFTEYDTGVFFSIPWVNFRKYSAGVREAEQSVEGARQQHQAARTAALGLLRDQLRSIASLSEQYALSRDQIVPLARQTEEALRAGYESDTSTFLDVVVAQRTLRDAEAAASMELAEYLAALAELEALVGIEAADAAPAKPFPKSKK